VFVRKFTAKGFLVHCVDFGREMLADEKFFRPLDAKFCSQPFGAMLCSLHSVRPFDDKLWTAEASRYFRKKVYSRKVTIYVRYNSKSRLFVDMFDPDSSEECLVNRALVAQGFAKEFKPTLGTAEAPF
jgi:PhoPQ-activated pathogenicity-related protein